jgi:hypothetical protein
LDPTELVGADDSADATALQLLGDPFLIGGYHATRSSQEGDSLRLNVELRERSALRG